MLSGAVNLFIADSFFSLVETNSSNKSSKVKASALMKQGAWQRDGKATDNSDEKVTYSNCSMKKLTD